MRQPIFKRLLGPDVATEEVDPHLGQGALLKAERPLVEGAAQTRVEQFTAGRVCSRAALGRFGVAATTPILRSEDRAPIWPKGFVGSISHTDCWCAAAVARSEEFRSLGIDLEPSTPLKEALWRRVCTATERERLSELTTSGLTAKVIFSVKEAVYKCQYPLTEKFLGFHAVEVELGDGEFEAVFQQEAGEFKPGHRVAGRYLVEEGLVAAACELPR
ncbi:MAG: 4'-phosphopantetheinyl transferase family protein [Polyangiales bacterium]